MMGNEFLSGRSNLCCMASALKLRACEGLVELGSRVGRVGQDGRKFLRSSSATAVTHELVAIK